MTLRLLPASGWNSWQATVLPSITLGAFQAPLFLRISRSAMLEVLNLDYVRTARAKGLGEWLVIVKHALKNAAIPIVTVIGLQFGVLLAGRGDHRDGVCHPWHGSPHCAGHWAAGFPGGAGRCVDAGAAHCGGEFCRGSAVSLFKSTGAHQLKTTTPDLTSHPVTPPSLCDDGSGGNSCAIPSG